MRVIMLDLDTLRPDHLGCYGYERNTSPNLDRIAGESVVFENYHCSDAPCLPSRAALTSGRFGIHNGVVGHGGTASDMRLTGPERDFRDQGLSNSFFNIFRKAGLHTASVSSFPERHSAYWFSAGLNEEYNCGGGGTESAEEVLPMAMDWLEKNGSKDDWFLHLNFWDAHTPYRAPEDFGNPFADSPLPSWMTEEVFAEHLRHVGPHSINEINMYDGIQNPQYPRQPASVARYEELRRVVDGYDCGIRYMDAQIGEILRWLEKNGLYDQVSFLVTADHGENLGELGIYCEHATADEITTRIPMMVKLPGVIPHRDKGLHYSLDILPTLAEFFGVKPYEKWDGKSFLASLMKEEDTSRPYLVVSQCAHVCQRAVRFDHYIYIRTYHAGYHLYPAEMLFDLETDFYQQNNLAGEQPELCARACRDLCQWQDEMMQTGESDKDPMWTVIREGGPHHTRGYLEVYIRQLEETGRTEGAKVLRQQYGLSQDD